MPPVAIRRFAVVTGASSGIGLAVSRELAGRGHNLLLVADDDSVHGAAAELPGRSHALRVDLATREGVEAMTGWIDESGRRVSSAVVDAGLGVPAGRVGETDLAADPRLLGVDVGGTVQVTKELVRRMVDAGEGRLLLTSGGAAPPARPHGPTLPAHQVSRADPNHPTAAASGASVHSLAQGLRRDLHLTGVTVTALQPAVPDGPACDRVDRLARLAVDAMLAGEAQVFPDVADRLPGRVTRLLLETVRARMHAATSLS